MQPPIKSIRVCPWMRLSPRVEPMIHWDVEDVVELSCRVAKCLGIEDTYCTMSVDCSIIGCMDKFGALDDR